MAVAFGVVAVWLIIELIMLTGIAAWILLLVIVWVKLDPHDGVEIDDDTKR